MNWQFWKKEPPESSGSVQGPKLDKPKDLPEAVGRKMVVDLKMDPDEVWALKYVSRPMADRKKTSEFRIFNPVRTHQAGLVVKNWTSLDERLELVMFTGVFDKDSNRVEISARG